MTKERNSEEKDIQKSFLEHLQELRLRLFYCAVSIFIFSCIGYYFFDRILYFLIKPLNQPLFYTNPSGGFQFTFKISIFFGIVLSIPVLIYHLTKFLEPMISSSHKRLVIKMLSASFVLMLLGLSFAYFISLPAALHFLNKFSTDSIKSLISTDEYFSFISVYLLGFSLLFQLPIILLLLNTVTKLHARNLFKKQRIVIVASFIIAAILTPTPDPINQIIMAVPMILLYQISITLVWWINRKNNQG